MDLTNFQGLHRANGMAAGPDGNAFSNGICNLEMFGQKGARTAPSIPVMTTAAAVMPGIPPPLSEIPSAMAVVTLLGSMDAEKMELVPKKDGKGNGRGNADKTAKGAADEDGQEMFMQNSFLPIDRKSKHSCGRT